MSHSNRFTVPASGVIFISAVLATVAAGQEAPRVQSFPLADGEALTAEKAKVEAVEYKGRKAVRLTAGAGGGGYALLKGVEFQDGIIEADVAVKTTTPPGVRMPGFLGIAFRVRTGGSHYELFYVRPGNSNADDQAMRNHTVQYCAEPGFDWYRLRRTWPWVYEAHAELELEQWIHMKFEVAGRRAKLYLNDSAKPALIVDGLKGEDLKGGVALWGFSGEESYFANLKISHAKAEPVANGGEVSGAWTVRCATDAGVYDGTLSLKRDGNKVTGTWTGAFGSELPVTGTWRDGYVELGFSGTWATPNDKPGAAQALLAGWIDGPSGRGRMKVVDRADGQWTAERKQ
ncbi:hypothetical protein [uncultured Paludibaculum sp.]|uniref:hypothetical protein n=1 Tax=uncultured Paludibaculum sp. TaxID=1765020 RepID=UPI002AAAA50B|nr:hypothetical protein [uncultured Paludibaculum sp.]